MSNQIDRKLLHEALLKAFNRSDLERMLDFELGIPLNRITGQGNLESTVFDIIEHFRKRDQLYELVRVASEKRPNNATLRQLATNLPPPQTPAAPPQQSSHTTVHIAKGGVYVDGNVTGDITTGDNNTKK